MATNERFKAYCKDRKKLTSIQLRLLLEEVNDLCPKCGKHIYTTSTNAKKGRYEVAHVFPNSPTPKEEVELKDVPLLGTDSEDLANKIPLCYDCHTDYDDEKTYEKYMEMYQIKRRVQREADAKQTLSRENIESELVILIQKLAIIPQDEFENPDNEFKDVLTINEKIPKTEMLLRQKITLWVTSYYSYIANCFKNQGFSTTKYEVIKTRMHMNYLIAKDKGLTVKEIFDSLTQWLMSKTQASRESCEIMVSYFTQSCDVYDKIAE